MVRWVSTVLLLVAVSSMFAQSTAELRKALDAEQMFALQEAVERGGAPLLYRGVVEAAENRRADAERDLRAVVAASPHSDDSWAALNVLAEFYLRAGRYREAHDALEAAHAERPNDAEVNNARALYAVLARSRDMEVVSAANEKLQLACDMDGGCPLPVRINGHVMRYGFDTGASLSVMGTSDARLLGLRVRRAATRLGEASGTDLPETDVAFAKDLVIGGLHLRNVAFFVMDDTGEPFVHSAPGQRGLIGLPVLLAMRKVRWSRDGGLAMGDAAAPAKPAAPNLLLAGVHPLVRVEVQGTPLVFSLDTGASDTDLNEGFAKALPRLVAAGTKERRPIMGMGGSNTYDSVLLGATLFRVGGAEITLAHPHVFPAHSLGKWDGNLGHDILDQAHAVTLDFDRMAMTFD